MFYLNFTNFYSFILPQFKLNEMSPTQRNFLIIGLIPCLYAAYSPLYKIALFLISLVYYLIYTPLVYLVKGILFVLYYIYIFLYNIVYILLVLIYTVAFWLTYYIYLILSQTVYSIVQLVTFLLTSLIDTLVYTITYVYANFGSLFYGSVYLMAWVLLICSVVLIVCKAILTIDYYYKMWSNKNKFEKIREIFEPTYYKRSNRNIWVIRIGNMLKSIFSSVMFIIENRKQVIYINYKLVIFKIWITKILYDHSNKF